jgi:hypothetical protein
LSLPIKIIDPTVFPSWDEMLLGTPGASFFHSAAWARVLSQSYGYTPLYFTVIEGGKLRALVPLMEVNSFLTGKRGVSLPFTDYCEPILEEGIAFQELFDPIIDHGKKRGWKYIELRGEYGRSQESGIRNQASGVRSQESGVRSQESGFRSQESGKTVASCAFPRSERDCGLTDWKPGTRNISFVFNPQPATRNSPLALNPLTRNPKPGTRNSEQFFNPHSAIRNPQSEDSKPETS